MKLAHVEAAILVGGASTRMGRDKAALVWNGKPLAAHVAEVLGSCVERVRLVTRPGAAPPVDLPCIEDRARQRAPLVGIHAALAACEASAVLIAGGDMPLIDPRIVLALLALVPAAPDGPDIVAPQGPRGPEPLLAVYRPSLLPEISRRIERDELALMKLLRDANTLLIPEAELRALDPELRSFRNLNRAEDVAELQAEVAAHGA